MFKKIIALLMVLVICSGTITAFGNSNISLVTENIIEDGITKTIQYFDKIKIVSWEEENKLIVEQYDADGILVETSIGDRQSKEIVIKNSTGSYTINANDALRIISEEDIPIPYSFKKIATIKASNILTSTRKTMNLFEEIETAKNTTYEVTKYNGRLATFITSVGIGIGVSALVAGNIIGAIVSAGLGIISGEVINITSSVTLSCKAYAYNYYGQDSISGDKSTTYNKSGYKYVINDDYHVAFKDKVYYDGLLYNMIDSDTNYKLTVMLVRNLYGVDFDIY